MLQKHLQMYLQILTNDNVNVTNVFVLSQFQSQKHTNTGKTKQKTLISVKKTLISVKKH
jgi:hypothetical protein